MLIKALCDYCDLLEKKSVLIPESFSKVGIKYLVSLNDDGSIGDIVDWQTPRTIQKKGKGTTVFDKREILLPKRSASPTIKSYLLEHRPAYLFGLHYDKESATVVVNESSSKKHKEFVKTNLEFISSIDSRLARAYTNFIQDWNPEDEISNPLLLSIKNDLAPNSSAYFAFCLSGRPDLLLHEDELIIDKWKTLYERDSSDESDAIYAQCGITGDILPIARLHDAIKGVPGGSASGCRLICFNNEAQSSYGQEQSYNSNISSVAMKKYTRALNYLLNQRNHKTTIGDLTILHWAMSEQSEYDDLASMIMFGDENTNSNSEEIDAFLKSLTQDIKLGTVNIDRLNEIKKIDPNIDFYIVGLKPARSRLSIKFVYRHKFGDILNSVAQHINDISLNSNLKPIPLWRIRQELISPKLRTKNSSTNVNPALMSGLLSSIVNGTNYPDSLFMNVINRIKVDSDVDGSDGENSNYYLKMNDIRIGILKGYINRKSRVLGQKEEIGMSLDRENTNQAYLCGRLFAVLESIQRKSTNYTTKNTIKESYFASASSRPAQVFPKLIKMSTYHLSKLGNPKYLTDDIEEIIGLLGSEFPTILSLADQGKFMIGYYQQRSYISNKIKEFQEESKNA